MTHKCNYNYTLLNSPCKSCGNRVIGCHSRCINYITFKAELDKLKETQLKIKAEEDNYLGHISEFHRKRRKRNKI